MKKIKVVLSVVLLLVVPAGAFLFAEPVEQDFVPTSPVIEVIYAAFLALAGWPAFQVAAVGLLKMLGWIPDGMADKVVYWSTVIALVGVGYLVLTGQTDLLATIDAYLGNVAKIVVDISILIGTGVFSLAVNKFIYNHVGNYPVIGYSHTDDGWTDN